MNVAITGITGMVGSHLIKKLVEENNTGEAVNVRALIRESSLVDHLKAYEDVDYVIGGLEDKDSLAKLVEGMDVVFHLAHFGDPVQNAADFLKVNINGTFDLLEACRKARVKQFVFMSSCTIFGQILPTVDADHPLDETHPAMPGSLYGAIKSSIESFCFFFQRSRAFNITILRPVTIYGVKPQIDKSEWFNTIDFLATNYNVDLKGSTKYVSVDSVTQALTKVMGNADSAGKIYHLVDGHIHNMELGQMIVDTIDSFGEIEGVMGEEGVPMSNQAARDLGVEFPGKDGIREYIKLVHKLQTTYGGERLVDKW